MEPEESLHTIPLKRIAPKTMVTLSRLAVNIDPQLMAQLTLLAFLSVQQG
jgi:hypothetical protein